MLKIFLLFSRREWALIALSVGLIVFGVWLDLEIPTYLGRITQIVTVPESEGTIGDVWRFGGIMLALAASSAMTAVAIAWIGAVVSSGHSARMRKLVYEKVGDFSSAEIKNFSVASLITRSTNDVNQVRLFSAMAIQILIRAPIIALWAILRMTSTSWHLTLTTFVAVAALVLVLTLLIIIVMPRYNKIQTLTDKLNQVTRENLSGIRVVRAFGAEDFEQEKFEKANEAYQKNSLVVHSAMAIFWPFMSMLISILTVAIYWVGAWLMSGGTSGIPMESAEAGMYLGNMMVFSQYSIQIMFAFLMLLMILVMLPRTIVSGRRIREVLATDVSIKDGGDGVIAKPAEKNIKFSAVNFKYPDAEENVLSDINLEIKAGQTVAFVGGTGCGKSTLVNLLPRIYDATSGNVEIGGMSVKDMSLEELNSIVGYVPQTAVLFNGTIKSNVAFGEVGGVEISDEMVEEALKTAQAWEFVSKLEKGIEAEVAQAGKNLSGGQKQRIGIARVLARKPQIIIFDDTFSALDYQTDRKLRSALKADTKGATVLIVAQRIGTIKDCDLIFVLDKGRIVGSGTHKELLKSNTVYKEIAQSQLSKEELAGGAK